MAWRFTIRPPTNEGTTDTAWSPSGGTAYSASITRGLPHLERVSAHRSLALKLLLDPVANLDAVLELILVPRQPDALAGATAPNDTVCHDKITEKKDRSIDRSANDLMTCLTPLSDPRTRRERTFESRLEGGGDDGMGQPWAWRTLLTFLVWGAAPLGVWMLGRIMLIQPAEAQLRSAQHALLAAERAELEGMVALQRDQAKVESMRRRRDTLIADAARLKAARATAQAQIRKLDSMAAARQNPNSLPH